MNTVDQPSEPSGGEGPLTGLRHAHARRSLGPRPSAPAGRHRLVALTSSLTEISRRGQSPFTDRRHNRRRIRQSSGDRLHAQDPPVVQSSGRCFVALPQANGQMCSATVVEIVGGAARPFPGSVSNFTSVQGLRSEGEKLYALDTGPTELSGCDPARAALLGHRRRRSRSTAVEDEIRRAHGYADRPDRDRAELVSAVRPLASWSDVDG